MLDTTEDKIGLGLLVLGSVILIGFAVASESVIATAVILGIYGVYTVVSVIAGVGAAFATAAIMSTSFGLFGPAVLRLAGIIVFTASISAAIPFGGLLSLIVYVVLLMWLFELELLEVIVFTIILWIMRFVVAILLAIMLAGALAAVA